MRAQNLNRVLIEKIVFLIGIIIKVCAFSRIIFIKSQNFASYILKTIALTQVSFYFVSGTFVSFWSQIRKVKRKIVFLCAGIKISLTR